MTSNVTINASKQSLFDFPISGSMRKQILMFEKIITHTSTNTIVTKLLLFENKICICVIKNQKINILMRQSQLWGYGNSYFKKLQIHHQYSNKNNFIKNKSVYIVKK